MATFGSASQRKFARGLTAALALLLILASAQFAAPPAFSCAAPGDGSPSCGGSGVAALSGGGTGSVMAGAGNPINLLSGNKYQEDTDLAALPGVLGLEFKRYYNSQSSYPGLAGAQWHTSYETVLYDLGTQVQIVQADGRRITLQRGQGAKAQLCVSPQPQDGQVQIETQGQERLYRWRWTDGRTLTFKAIGQANGGYPLHEIRAATGERMQLAYNPLGDLISVTDPQGRKLVFSYGKAAPGQRALLATVATPLGRIDYRHDALGRLVSVAQPDGRSTRLYHYESRYNSGNEYALTGISVKAVEAGQALARTDRLSTFAYDAQGRAVLSTKGLPIDPGQATDSKHGIEQIRVEYQQKPSPNEGPVDKSGEVRLRPDHMGRVQLTNSLGQVSQLKTAVIGGQLRLVEFLGAGCATCGPSNRRYGYDSMGRLLRTTVLDDGGQPMLDELQRYDGFGRLVQLSQQAYQQGKLVRSAQPLRRYEYTDVKGQDGSLALGQQPTLLAQPSVVPGKERTARLAYNDVGQVLSVTESGWSPVDDAGEPVAAGVALVRTTSYRYAPVNGRSLLVEMDGPLPNGPKADPSDSDVTRFKWSADGSSVIEVVQPGGWRSMLTYDGQTGRVASVRNDEGLVTQLTYNAHGVPTLMRTQGPGWPKPVVRSIQYDALDRPVEWGRGELGTPDYRGEQRTAYDVANRLSWRASPSGMLEQFEFDGEGHLLWHSRRMGQLEKAEMQVFDSHGRLTQIRTSEGPGLDIERGEQGEIERMTDALGRRHERSGRRALTAAAAVQRTLDDWGRVVRTRSADAGQTLRRFDVTDRLVGAQDAIGQHARYVYDLQGRIAEQQILSRNGAPVMTRWRYKGRQLVALEHPTQNESYERDARGLVTAKTVQRPGITVVTRTTYDEQGRPIGQSLPDGSWMRFRRDGLGQVVAIERERIGSAWLRWLLPTQVVVSGMQRDLVGVRHVTSGNGLTNDWVRDREGVLARLFVRNPRVDERELDSRFSQLMEILGIGTARADVDVPRTPLHERQAMQSHRFLWDVQGNLLSDANPAGRTQSSYAYDSRDRLVMEADVQPTGPRYSRWYFDAAGRRVLQQQGQPNVAEFVAGTEKPSYQSGTHRWIKADSTQQSASYDARGLPLQLGARQLEWDALGRLVTLTNDAGSARYTYNHRGERIAKQVQDRSVQYFYDEQRQLVAELNGDNRLVRQIIYAGDMPVALIDTPQGSAPGGAEPGIGSDLKRIMSAWFRASETLSWLHVNHLNQVELATDAQGATVWRAEYAAHGALIHASGTLNVTLRLPGQVYDEESGLHYNGQRYYDPQRGEYLTPDPLGTPDGPNPYAYVRANPLRYVDPDGLILFAFDGTGNTDNTADLAALGNGLSNVVRFRDLYADGNTDYVTGVGTRHRDAKYGDIYLNWGNTSTVDMGTNQTGPKRIERMVQYFMDEADDMDDETAMEVDIVGFSRGSAEARDFANRIVANTKDGYYQYKVTVDGKEETRCQKVDFRFMGLFDTVLSTNWSGTSYQLAVPDVFAHVSQAVALNEYRGNTLRQLPGSTGAFPVESIYKDQATPVLADGKTRTEMGFVGSHADIGGGFSADAELSRVALAWMVEQAKEAGVAMNSVSGAQATVPPSAVLHDKSDNQYCLTGPGCKEDRTVRYQGGSTDKQRTMAFSTGMTYADTGQFISYYPATGVDENGNTIREPKADFTTGTVDMNSYVAWLKSHGYNLGALSVQ